MEPLVRILLASFGLPGYRARACADTQPTQHPTCEGLYSKRGHARSRRIQHLQKLTHPYIVERCPTPYRGPAQRACDPTAHLQPSLRLWGKMSETWSWSRPQTWRAPSG